MTFSEYFNALYPYLSNGEKPVVFFDSMIGHFIHEEAQESCELLDCKIDTKKRYIREINPNKINKNYAQYSYSNHNSDQYKQWLFDRMYLLDSFDKIEKWLTSCSISFSDCCAACDTLLSDIFFNIAFPNTADNPGVNLPPKAITEAASSQQHSENDMNLLTKFHIDFDSIIEKCITNDQAEVWFTHNLSTKIDKLYKEKWKEDIFRFENIKLQSDILSTIATLYDFCKALNPDSESVPDCSVRKLRMKLRNDYVKIHPNEYTEITPHDVFIDDWNDGEEFEI